jgi:DNA polymerase-3 subunit delta
MIYLIHGDDYYLVEDKISEFTKKYPKYAIYSFDGSDADTPVALITEAARSQSLFGEASLIIVRHPSFFYKKMADNEKKELEDYVADPSFNCDLIFCESGESFSKDSVAFKTILKNARVFHFQKLKGRDYYDYARGYVSSLPVKMSKEAARMLIDRSRMDTGRLHQNCEKLVLYGDFCSEKVVDKLCPAEIDDDIFKLINAITEKNASLAFYYLQVYEQKNQYYNYLISTLASQYRFLYLVGYMSSHGSSTKEIMKAAKTTSEYRVKKAYETLRMLSLPEIISVLDKLHHVDKALKSGDQIADRQHIARFIMETAGIA